MIDWPILSTIVFFPLVGAVILLFIKGDDKLGQSNIRNVAFFTTLFVFVISLIIWFVFDKNNPNFQMEEQKSWLEGVFTYHLGVDGISILFVVLTAFLFPFCVLINWDAIQDRLKVFMVALLLLETMLLGVFCSLNAILFYIFFEGSLIPMFIIIGVWGGPRRVYATFKFFLYTVVGSLLLLVALMVMYKLVGSLELLDLFHYSFPRSLQLWLWLAFFSSFAVKLPMWPFHTWLRDAHVEAPTAGSVLLAAIMLKLAGYGFLRFMLPLFPEACSTFQLPIMVLSVIAIIYASLVALAQEDIKKLIAYSSVAHMGYTTMGIFSNNVRGIQGALFQMLSHGLVSAGLFLGAGMIYERVHSREIAAFGGLAKNMPHFAVAFMVFILANIGFPGTTGFLGEFLPFSGSFQLYPKIVAVAALGVVLSASYSLYLYRRVIFGPLEKESLKGLRDLNLREKCILYPFAFFIIFFGVFPDSIFSTTNAAVQSLLHRLH